MHKEHGEMMDDQIDDRSAITDTEKNSQGTADAVNGTISYSNKVTVFTPDMELKEGTLYTFTVTTGVKNLENNALENDHTWSFRTTGSSDSTNVDMQNDNYSMDRNEFSESTTDSTLNNNMNMNDLGKAGQYVILAKTSVINNSASRFTGLIGEGSEADSLKNETVDSVSTQPTTTGQVSVLQSTQSNSSTSDVTEAIEDMMSAYSHASMQNGNDSTCNKNESLHDTALTSGIHEWSDSLNIESDVTLSGGADDVWVFKVDNDLTVNENTVFTLTNGARADNIFWVVEGEVTIGENAIFEGIILSMNEITLEKGAKLNGRMFSQTSINLDDNIVTEPGNMTGQRTSTNR